MWRKGVSGSFAQLWAQGVMPGRVVGGGRWCLWPIPRKQLALGDCWAQLSTATFLHQSNIGLNQEELGDFRP